MQVRIGVIHAPQIDLDITEGDQSSVRKLVEDALVTEGGVLWLSDKKGTQVGVPAEKIAYVSIASGEAHPRIGFASD